MFRGKRRKKCKSSKKSKKVEVKAEVVLDIEKVDIQPKLLQNDVAFKETEDAYLTSLWNKLSDFKVRLEASFLAEK